MENIKQLEMKGFQISNSKRYVLIKSVEFLNGGGLENNDIIFRIWANVTESKRKVEINYWLVNNILPINNNTPKKTDLFKAIEEMGHVNFELSRLQLFNTNGEINIEIEILSA